MNLKFDISLAEEYQNASQKTRIFSEAWFDKNMYCPICKAEHLRRSKPNSPVKDFVCDKCNSEFELKAHKRKSPGLPTTYPAGAYKNLKSRINEFNSPHFFFLTYFEDEVKNLIFVPNRIMTQKIIKKRKKLSVNAKRKGWIGGTIRIDKLPSKGKIFVIQDSIITTCKDVRAQYHRFKGYRAYEERGWLLDIHYCINQLAVNDFTPDDLYVYEQTLRVKHPNNNNIKAKIRQGLRELAKMRIIQHPHRGHYRK